MEYDTAVYMKKSRAAGIMWIHLKNVRWREKTHITYEISKTIVYVVMRTKCEKYLHQWLLLKSAWGRRLSLCLLSLVYFFIIFIKYLSYPLFNNSYIYTF